METHKLFPGKYFISSILEMLEYKSEMTGQTKRRYLMRAAMAGVIVTLKISSWESFPFRKPGQPVEREQTVVNDPGEHRDKA